MVRSHAGQREQRKRLENGGLRMGTKVGRVSGDPQHIYNEDSGPTPSISELMGGEICIFSKNPQVILKQLFPTQLHLRLHFEKHQ